MKYLIILLSSLLYADSISIEPLATSYHFDRDKDYNENHKYIGLLYKHDNGFELGASTMENSHYKRSNSVYIGYSDSFYEFDRGEIGAFGDIGYRTGYTRKELVYVGVYAEYMNAYVKIGGGTNMIGAVFGYTFKFKGL